jgi:intracellular sulfur oxidation DsrE/DsrF family protein
MMFLAGFASAAILGLGAGGLAYAVATGGNNPQPEAAPVHLAVPDIRYGAQKVVYHVANRGSWRDRESEAWRLVAVLNNHINAVEPDDIAIRVIFQGDGVDALRRAAGNPKLADAFDRLKARGVVFRVCARTLEAARMGVSTLHGISEADLVQAGVAELIHLQQRGHAYIRF